MEPVSVYVLVFVLNFNITQHKSMGTFDGIEKTLDMTMVGKAEASINGYKDEASCQHDLEGAPKTMKINDVDMTVTEVRCVKQDAKDLKKS
jgi:hypothetical protein